MWLVHGHIGSLGQSGIEARSPESLPSALVTRLHFYLGTEGNSTGIQDGGRREILASDTRGKISSHEKNHMFFK